MIPQKNMYTSFLFEKFINPAQYHVIHPFSIIYYNIKAKKEHKNH